MSKKLRCRYDIFFIVILFVLSIPAEYYEILSFLEDQTLSFRHVLRTVCGDQKICRFPKDKIVLVSLDDEFQERYGRYPLKRSDLARIIDNLKTLDARVICLDLLLKYPDAYGEDADLSLSIMKAKNVVLASQALFDEKNNTFDNLIFPAPELNVSPYSGYINILSPSTAYTYLNRLRIYPEIVLKEKEFPIAVQVAANYLNVTPELKDRELILGHIRIPLDQFNDFYIDFSPLPKTTRYVHEYAGIPAYDVLELPEIGGYEYDELRYWISDKIVIIGDTSRVSSDSFNSPVGMIYGAGIIAETVKTLLNGAPLKPAGIFLEMTMTLLLLGSILVCSSVFQSPDSRTACVALLFFFFISICTLLYVYQGIAVSMTYNIIAGFLGYAVISLCDMKEQRKSLKKAEEKYRSIYEHAFEGIFQINEDGIFVSLNPALADILGFDSADELFSKYADFGIRGFASQEDRERLLLELNKNNNVIGFETQFVRKDGTSIWVTINARTVRNEKGNLIWYEGSLMDISQQKEKEKIEKERRTAEASNKAKSEFLANMSHEIRTPMNAIMGLTEITLRGRLDAEQRSRMETALESTRHLLTIIDDILDFSKIEAGKIEIEQIDFDLHPLVESILHIHEGNLRKKKLTLHSKIADEVPRYLKGDPGRIRQVLNNLLSNAIKFTDEGTITLDIRKPGTEFLLRRFKSEISSNEVNILFSVRDTGIGLSDNMREKIFEKFQQADSSTTRKYGGTGLGLTISKRLIELMNGIMWVESQKNNGSNFLFLVGFKIGDPLMLSKQLFKSETEKLPIIGNPKILLVEDNPHNIEVACAFLTELKCETLTASNGKQAIQLLTTHHFHIIFMDIEMPEMDGFEATKKIRRGEAGEKNRYVPIIAMTAHAIKGYREKCIEAGMNDYIPKPFNFSDISNVLKIWLQIEHQQTNETIEHEGAPDADACKELPAIDIKAGILRLRGNRSLYFKLLRDFKANYSDYSQKIKLLIEKGDMENAKQIIHSLKGVSGNISADVLYAETKKLEQAVISGTEDIFPLLAQFENAFHQTMKTIGSLETNNLDIDVDKPNISSPIKTNLDSQSIILELASLIRSHNPKAEDYLNSLNNHFSDDDLIIEIKGLKEDVQRFEFKNAQTRLNRIANALGLFLPPS